MTQNLKVFLEKVQNFSSLKNVFLFVLALIILQYDIIIKMMRKYNFAELEKIFSAIREVSRNTYSTTYLFRNREDGSIHVCKSFMKSKVNNDFIDIIQYIYKQNIQNIVKYQMYCDDSDHDRILLIRPFIKYDNISDYVNGSNYNNGTNSSNMKKMRDLILINNEKSSKALNTDFFGIWKEIVSIFAKLQNYKYFDKIIKPSNIFIKNDNSVVIADLYPAPKEAFSAVSTLAQDNLIFLAPELFTNEYAKSEKSDMWSLGAILLFYSGYNLPWSTINICSMINTISRNNIHITNEMPSSLYNILSKLLVHNPNERASAKEILQEYQNTTLIAKTNFFADKKRKSVTTPETLQKCKRVNISKLIP